MANADMAKRDPEPEVDNAIWRHLPEELVEKCLGHLPVLSIASTVDPAIWRELPENLVEKCFGHLPVLTIASKLREVNKAWRDYPGTPAFMNLHNHGKNLNSSFGFLMYDDRIPGATNRCETMVLNHDTLKWQMAPSLHLHDHYGTCKMESVSEGLILLRLRSATSHSFIVWNPLIRCEQAVPGISLDYTNVNLVADRATGTFKVVAFSASFRDCLTYSPTTGSWESPVNYEGPGVYNGLFFARGRGRLRGIRLRGDHMTVAYKKCVYVAVESFRNIVHEVGDFCYDVERNVWKPAMLFRVSPASMGSYDYCFTASMFVVNDVMYKVVEYQAGFDRRGNGRPHPAVQILARSLAPAPNNGGAWAEIANRVLPHGNWEITWLGPWYGVGPWYMCTLGGHEKPTICGLFYSNNVHDANLYMMMYDVGKSTWKKVCVTNAAQHLQSFHSSLGHSLDGPTSNEGELRIERKWKVMRMVLHYTPSWICPVAQCTHHHIES